MFGIKFINGRLEEANLSAFTQQNTMQSSKRSEVYLHILLGRDVYDTLLNFRTSCGDSHTA